MKTLKRNIKPIAMSVAAAALTAVAFAAVSVAKDDDKGGESAGEGDGARFEQRIGPPELSEEQEQALESFKQCMEDEGAPAPPRPGDLEDGERPEPPSGKERERIESAMEACRDELPEGVHPPGPPGPPCPPPGTEGERGEGAALPAPPPGAPQEGEVEQAPEGASS